MTQNCILCILHTAQFGHRSNQESGVSSLSLSAVSVGPSKLQPSNRIFLAAKAAYAAIINFGLLLVLTGSLSSTEKGRVMNLLRGYLSQAPRMQTMAGRRLTMQPPLRRL